MHRFKLFKYKTHKNLKIKLKSYQAAKLRHLLQINISYRDGPGAETKANTSHQKHQKQTQADRETWDVTQAGFQAPIGETLTKQFYEGRE